MASCNSVCYVRIDDCVYEVIRMPYSQNETLFSVPPKQKKVWLSHTGIEGANRCKRCFYLQYKYKIRQPEGIQSRLANRFDTILKQHFNKYRTQGILPPLIAKEISGVLESPFQETYFHTFNQAYGFFGKLDECLIDKGKYIPVDFKTSSSDPREKEILEAYQNQIDEYVYLLEENRKQTNGYGYLIFFYPEISGELHNGFPMVTHIVKVKARKEDVPKRIENAITILEGSLPDSSEGCPYCAWFRKVEPFYTLGPQ